MKLGIIDAGGGLRGSYSAGVLDRCLDDGVRFDLCIGVSAGAGNLVSFMAGQRDRNMRFYEDYAFRQEYMGMKNFLKTGSYVNVRYIYGTLTNSDGEDPLDFNGMMENPADILVVAQEARTGKVKYFMKDDFKQDDYRPLMASSNIPGVNRPFKIDGVKYFDGALADPVPVEKAFEEGCSHVVIVLTKPAGIPRTPGQDPFIARMIRARYPRSAENLMHRTEKYNASVWLGKKYEAQGKVLIVSPDNTEGIKTLSKDVDGIKRMYAKGYDDGGAIGRWIEKISETEEEEKQTDTER